jgi:LemA protein
MNQRSKIGLVIGGFLILLIIYFGATYNRLVKREENVKLTWGDLQNAYQRRLDLVPNLVTVVKGSSDYEKQTLDQLATARAKAQQLTVTATELNAANFNQQEQVQTEMVQSINRVIGLVEKYPDLQSTKSFLYLQTQLEGTERRIKVTRSDFNGSVAQYNKLVRGFPSNLPASLFGFKPKEGFQSENGAENSPEVKF